MKSGPNGAWFTCLPPCETQVPCGTGRHTVRWEAGSLRLLSHSDVEGELVLAALGGDKARCVEVAQAWDRHADDLSVLAIGPRGPADQIAVDWHDVREAEQAGFAVHGSYVSPRSTPMRLASQPGPTLARAGARQRQAQEERLKSQRRRTDVLSLLALGYGFQARLAGQVAAAYAAEPTDERARPALVAAITGRLAPIVEDWIGLDPGQVVVSLHDGPGWGSVEMTGRGEERRLRVALPAGWLARVWASGLAATGRHLVVAVQQAGWPDARVLALRAPGAEPVELDVHGATGPGDAQKWEVR